MAGKTRTGMGPATAHEKAMIDRFLAHGCETAENAIAKLRETPREHRDKWYQNQLDYWQHALKFARWLRARNQYRKTAKRAEVTEHRKMLDERGLKME